MFEVQAFSSCAYATLTFCYFKLVVFSKHEAEAKGYDDALMLDLNGFVSETNATNIFMTKDVT